jgi:hypothetical protein
MPRQLILPPLACCRHAAADADDAAIAPYAISFDYAAIYAIDFHFAITIAAPCQAIFAIALPPFSADAADFDTPRR